MIGEIPGGKVGTVFPNREALHYAGVHGGFRSGIGKGGTSIVLSGGYPDDVDSGEEIIYTGYGGRDPKTGRQIADQKLIGGNRFLAEHFKDGTPIRVTRGFQLKPPYAPATGYRYDGLYIIEDCWKETGRDGFLIWRYRLTKLSENKNLLLQPQIVPPKGQVEPTRTKVYTTRVIRNSEVGNHVKRIYKHTCQVSGDKLKTPTGPYAEACHIKPLGKPHNGPDIVENILCLTPNMHVLFDLGAITISDDLEVIGLDSGLKVHPDHKLSLECIRYHREHIYKGV